MHMPQIEIHRNFVDHSSFVALFSGLPSFCILFVLAIIHRHGRPAKKEKKNGEGLGAFITWTMLGGCEVDVGGERLNCQKEHIAWWPSVWMLYHSFGLQTLAWMKLFVLLSKELTFKFTAYILKYQLPLNPPPVHSSDEWSQASSIFRFHVLLWTQIE